MEREGVSHFGVRCGPCGCRFIAFVFYWYVNFPLLFRCQPFYVEAKNIGFLHHFYQTLSAARSLRPIR